HPIMLQPSFPPELARPPSADESRESAATANAQQQDAANRAELVGRSQVLEEERAWIRQRRAQAGFQPAPQNGAPADLVGLALSGGGIRSASFNLGVLQAFYRSGLLRFVDFLSTVSGGGYIGAFFSSRV